MPSMTGFGTGRAHGPHGEVRIQISAVNNRGWQVALRSELGDVGLEDEIKQELRRNLVRGTITVQIHVHTIAAGLPARDALAETWRAWATLAHDLGAPVPRLEDVARQLPHQRAAITDWSAEVRSALPQAIAGVQATRLVEGQALVAACRLHAAALRDLTRQMKVRAGERLPAWRDSLQTRLSEVLREAVTPETIVRELALHAERIDVTEEQVRLAAHLDALDLLLAGAEDPKAETGRRLEFLLQEVGREVNTTGAKANDAALAALVIEAKVAIDQLKEQAANLA